MGIEFRIGEVYDAKHIGTRSKPHKYILESRGQQLTLYASCTSNHFEVAERFGLKHQQPHNIVGGGDMYIEKSKLVLDAYSALFGGVPPQTAARFGALLLDYLKNQGVKVKSMETEPIQESLHPFWKSAKLK